jgi:hypothetical protein
MAEPGCTFVRLYAPLVVLWSRLDTNGSAYYSANEGEKKDVSAL